MTSFLQLQANGRRLIIRKEETKEGRKRKKEDTASDNKNPRLFSSDIDFFRLFTFQTKRKRKKKKERGKRIERTHHVRRLLRLQTSEYHHDFEKWLHFSFFFSFSLSVSLSLSSSSSFFLLTVFFFLFFLFFFCRKRIKKYFFSQKDLDRHTSPLTTISLFFFFFFVFLLSLLHFHFFSFSLLLALFFL